MIINEGKFPFKWMPHIIQVFNSHQNPLPTYRVARSIGSCNSDAKETLKMLQYITSYGSIIFEGGKWGRKTSNAVNNQEKPRFRYHYIKELIHLIKTLSEELHTLEEIANQIEKEKIDVERCLNFLLKITQDEVLFLINEVGISRRYTMSLPDKYGGKQ